MKKIITIIFILLYSISCNAEKGKTYTFKNFKDEFQDSYNIFDIPIGTYFWDEFKNYESYYNFTKEESKLFGRWMNATFSNNQVNNYYSFHPNNLVVIRFNYLNIRIQNTNNIYFDKAFGTWEIVNDIVKITIYSIMIEDRERKNPYNRDIFLIDNPYTVDFININDIGEEGYTKRPILPTNNNILSKELQKMVTIKEPNRTNNLYVRNVYTLDIIPETKKNYHYFTYFPEMAKNGHSGLEIATNPELIKMYIPDWMF